MVERSTNNMQCKVKIEKGQLGRHDAMLSGTACELKNIEIRTKVHPYLYGSLLVKQPRTG